MKKTTPKGGIKNDELFVLYTSADRATLEQYWHTNTDGTPRIFPTTALNTRIHRNTSICTNWDSALKLLWGGKGPVLVPLSMELLGHSAATIRRWAASQQDVKPQAVLDYINRISPPEPLDSRAFQYAQISVTTEQKWWITANPSGTLAELLALLESIGDECVRFDQEDFVVDHVDELSSEAVAYFSSWGELSEPVDENMPATFGYRRECLSEEIDSVELLYDSLGGDVVVATLAQALPRLTAC